MQDADNLAAAVPLRSAERLTWRETCALMRADFVRKPEIAPGQASLSQKILAFMQPNYFGIFLYRISRYMYLREWYGAATLLATLTIYLTRLEIPPATSIGAGCLINHAPAILAGRIGARFTCSGMVGCGGGMGTKDIGAGPGFPIIGDDVLLAFGANVLGPVTIGHGAHIGPGALVTFDVADGALVLWDRPRVIQGGAAPAAAR